MTPAQAAAAAAVYAQYGIMSPAEARQELEPIEQQRRDQDLLAHRVLGELMQRVPVNIRIGLWAVDHGGADVLLGGHNLSDHEVRGRVMLLAEQFDLNYGEHEYAPGQNKVIASGLYKGVPVRFWRLVPPCNCENCEAGR